MLEKILEFERPAFFMLNGSDSAFLDNLMWLYSGKLVWLPLAFFIILVICYKKNWKEVLFILLAITLVITLCDQFASHLCKPLFTRFRPTHHPDFMDDVKVVFGYRGGRYGFMSSHAANAFGFAMFMSLLFRSKPFTWVIFGWATINAYSRIYLGVHFISDIIPGALVGLFFGYTVYKLYLYSRRKSLHIDAALAEVPIYSNRRIWLIISGILITILILIVFNSQLITLIR